MKLTAREITQIRYKLKENKCSLEELDKILEQVANDYLEKDKGAYSLIEDFIPYIDTATSKQSKIKIDIDFNGTLGPDSVEYEGTKSDWEHIENKSIFADVHCINCKDGQYIQKL